MPLHKQLIIALVTGVLVGIVLMLLLDDPASAAALLDSRTSLEG